MIHKMMNGVSQWPRYSNTHSGEQFPTPYAYVCVCVREEGVKDIGWVRTLAFVCEYESLLSEMEWHSGRCCSSRHTQQSEAKPYL